MTKLNLNGHINGMNQLKCQYSATKVLPEQAPIEHIIISQRKRINTLNQKSINILKYHIEKYEKYAQENPEKINVRQVLSNLKDLLVKLETSPKY